MIIIKLILPISCYKGMNYCGKNANSVAYRIVIFTISMLQSNKFGYIGINILDEMARKMSRN